jgi:hypothetical protein
VATSLHGLPAEHVSPVKVEKPDFQVKTNQPLHQVKASKNDSKKSGTKCLKRNIFFQ